MNATPGLPTNSQRVHHTGYSVTLDLPMQKSGINNNYNNNNMAPYKAP